MSYYDKNSTFPEGSSVNMESIRSRMVYEIREIISKFNKNYVVVSKLHGSFIESQMRRTIIVSILNRYPKANSRVLKMIVDSIPLEYYTSHDDEQSLRFNFYSNNIEKTANDLEFSELDELYAGFYGHHFVDTHWRNAFMSMLTEIHRWTELNTYKELIDAIENNTVPTIDSKILVGSYYKAVNKIVDYTSISLQLMETVSNSLKSKLPKTLGSEFVLNVVVHPESKNDRDVNLYATTIQLDIPEVEVSIDLVYTYTQLFKEYNSAMRKILSKHKYGV